MKMQTVIELADMLIEAHGDRAEEAAARRQAEGEREGKPDDVEMWQRVRTVVRQKRGAHES